MQIIQSIIKHYYILSVVYIIVRPSIANEEIKNIIPKNIVFIVLNILLQ